MSITDRNGNLTTFAYDSSGDQTGVTDVCGRTITFSYKRNHIGRFRLCCIFC